MSTSCPLQVLLVQELVASLQPPILQYKIPYPINFKEHEVEYGKEI